jgi:EmrB/QacA subfamily drug resistance transporter
MTTTDLQSRDTGRSRRWALALVACVVVMDILDLTILNVAVPTIQAQLNANDAAIQWMVAGYATVFAVMLVTGGRLGDIFGYRLILMLGLAGFSLASLVCGLAPNADLLVAARLVQGVAAAMMLPQVSSLVQGMFAPSERVGALGMFGVLGGTAAVAGPLVGGALIAADPFGLGWRTIFLVNVPIGLALLVIAPRFLPSMRAPDRPAIDVTGTLMATATLAALMVPLVQGREAGWPWWSLASLALTPVLAVATWRHSLTRTRTHGSALIVPELLRNSDFRRGITMASAFQFALSGLLFVLTLELQRSGGLSPGEVGLVHAPFAIGSAIGIGLVSRRLVPRFGARLVTGGALLMIAALAALGWEIAEALHWWWLLPTMAVLGLGMGCASGPIPPISLSEVVPNHAGAASGNLKAFQQLGGAVGVAAVGGLFLSIERLAFPAALAAIGLALGVVALLALHVRDDLQVFARG